MRAPLLLHLGREESELQILEDALEGTGVRIVTFSDVSKAIFEADREKPDLIIVGPSASSAEARWLVERLLCNSSIRQVPVVIMFYEAKRSWVLEMIKLGIRSYIVLPREKEDLRKRLGTHLPPGTIPDGKSPSEKLRNSVGERLRQRIAKRQMEHAAAQIKASQNPEEFENIMLLDQQFIEESGLMIRSSKKEISLYEKIENYMLRLGGNHSHLVGIFTNLLVEGKVRVAFRNKTERLSLVDLDSKKTPEAAVRLIDDYLRQAALATQPDTQTQRIIM